MDEAKDNFLAKANFSRNPSNTSYDGLKAMGGGQSMAIEFFRGKETFFTFFTFRSREKLESIGDKESAWRWQNHRFGGQGRHKTIKGDRNNDDVTRNRRRDFVAGAMPAGTQQKRKTDTQNASLWANLK